jgi:hypothetical protein
MNRLLNFIGKSVGGYVGWDFAWQLRKIKAEQEA